MQHMRQAFYMLLVAALLVSSLVACAPWPERPQSTSYSSIENERAQEIVRLASHELGVPYLYGGDTPRGFDCSGLVYYVFRRTGFAVPRTANNQLYASHPVSLRELQPGDLVFFQIAGNVQMHVGIYVGNGVFIHAPETGQPVSYARLDAVYWKARFIGGGRF